MAHGMFKYRQEIFVVSELALFVLAWVLCFFAAAGDQRGHNHANVGDVLAESSHNSEFDSRFDEYPEQ